MTDKLFKPVAIFAVILIVCLLAYFNGCMKSKVSRHPIVDSALYFKAEYDIAKKQFGNEQAILMKEISAVNKRYEIALNENKAIRSHELQLTNTNNYLLSKLRKITPPECDSVYLLYGQIIDVKDSSYAALFDVFLKCDSLGIVKDSLITSYREENVVDSARLAITEREVVVAKKEVTKERKKGRALAAVVGGVMFIVWLVTGVIN